MNAKNSGPPPKLLIDATFICRGGGLVVLNELIRQARTFSVEPVVLITKPVTCHANTIHTTFLHRQAVIRQYQQAGFKVLNISNIPYIGRSDYTLLIHQRYYVDSAAWQYKTTLRSKLILALKIFIFRTLLDPRVPILVQSTSMKRLMRGIPNKCTVIRTYNDKPAATRGTRTPRRIVAMTDASPHKVLDLDRDRINFLLKKGYEIVIVGEVYRGKPLRNLEAPKYHRCLAHDDMLALLSTAEYVLTPSTFESLGLPFIEAALMGCKIIAYRSDICEELVDDYADLGADDLEVELQRVQPAKLKTPLPPLLDFESIS